MTWREAKEPSRRCHVQGGAHAEQSAKGAGCCRLHGAQRAACLVLGGLCAASRRCTWDSAPQSRRPAGPSEPTAAAQQDLRGDNLRVSKDEDLHRIHAFPKFEQ